MHSGEANFGDLDPEHIAGQSSGESESRADEEVAFSSLRAPWAPAPPSERLNNSLINVAVFSLMLLWALPVFFPISDWIQEKIGTDINAAVIVLLLIAALCLAIAMWRKGIWHHWRLLLLAFAADVLIGEIAARANFMLYLDTFGTVLVGMLLGPLAGAGTATISSCFWIIIAPSSVPFAVVNVVAGWLAGLFRNLDGYENRLTTIVSGMVAGLACMLVALPLSYALANSPVDRFSFDIYSSLKAVDLYFQTPMSLRDLLADPVDKALVFLMIAVIVPRIRRLFGIDSHPSWERNTKTNA